VIYTASNSYYREMNEEEGMTSGVQVSIVLVEMVDANSGGRER
jgi:hypothetical protein